jgi:hypothetical protein
MAGFDDLIISDIRDRQKFAGKNLKNKRNKI